MKKTIIRTISRPSAGIYSGVIDNWDILDKALTGSSEIGEVLMLKIKIQINKQHITTEKQIPLLWDKGDPMYNLCLQFDVLPEIGEEFECECFVGRVVEVIVEEEEREGRIYSSVAALRPLQGLKNEELPIQTKKLEIQQNATPVIATKTIENSITEVAPPSPQVKKIPPTGDIAPNRPRKKKIGSVRPETHKWGTM